MKCPKCGGATAVRETRDVRRRRTCLACDHRFTTREIVVADTLTVVKSTGQVLDRKLPKEKTPKPERAVAQVKKNTAARRELQERREKRQAAYNPFDGDNDFLPGY